MYHRKIKINCHDAILAYRARTQLLSDFSYLEDDCNDCSDRDGVKLVSDQLVQEHTLATLTRQYEVIETQSIRHTEGTN